MFRQTRKKQKYHIDTRCKLNSFSSLMHWLRGSCLAKCKFDTEGKVLKYSYSNQLINALTLIISTQQDVAVISLHFSVEQDAFKQFRKLHLSRYLHGSSMQCLLYSFCVLSFLCSQCYGVLCSVKSQTHRNFI